MYVACLRRKSDSSHGQRARNKKRREKYNLSRGNMSNSREWSADVDQAFAQRVFDQIGTAMDS